MFFGRRLRLATIGHMIEKNCKRFFPRQMATEICRDYGMFTAKGEIAFDRTLMYFEASNRWPVAGDELLAVALVEHIRVAETKDDGPSLQAFHQMLKWLLEHCKDHLSPQTLKKVGEVTDAGY